MSDLQILREKVKTLSILVVDDEVDVLNRSTVFMKKFFESTDSADSAYSALKKFHENDGYDIVMTDIMMPGMNGWELIKELRKIDKNMFIIAMTASPKATVEELTLVDSYLEKPVGVEILTEVLKKIIEKQGL